MTAEAIQLGDYVLRIEGVTVNRSGRCILRDVNASIRNVHREGRTQGQVVALLGPSGIGKTTLFRVLSGLEHPTSGRILLNAEGIPVQRGMVGVVAQNYPLFAHRTVISNLLVSARAGGLHGPDADKKAHEALARFDLEGVDGHYPAQLSGGQRQRVAIAQQFLCSEHFLLMDEPFSGLDVGAQARVIDFIDEIAASDDMNTFIVVTHDVRAALAVADTVWLMGRERDEKGSIIPGARIIDTIDLVALGIAWHPDLVDTPEFTKTENSIRARFKSL